MAGTAPQVTFAPVAAFGWLELAHLSDLPGAGPRDLRIWQRGVAAGRLQIVAIAVAGERVGTLVYDLETERDGQTALVVQAVYARPVAGVDVTHAVAALFEAMAAAAGVDALRFWTVRPGLARKAKKLGFAPRYVMEKRLT